MPFGQNKTTTETKNTLIPKHLMSPLQIVTTLTCVPRLLSFSLEGINIHIFCLFLQNNYLYSHHIASCVFINDFILNPSQQRSLSSGGFFPSHFFVVAHTHTHMRFILKCTSKKWSSVMLNRWINWTDLVCIAGGHERHLNAVEIVNENSNSIF